jgi:hypothetical protein
MHPRLSRRAAWLDHPADQDLPILQGTLIRLQVDRLPGDRTPKPLWLWTSRADTTAEQVDRAWQAFLRRFDLDGASCGLAGHSPGHLLARAGAHQQALRSAS